VEDHEEKTKETKGCYQEINKKTKKSKIFI